MSATRSSASRLETPRTQQIGNGYNSRTLLARLAEADAEKEQRDRWLAMFKDCERKPAPLYEFTRAVDRRAAVADNRQRKLVQAGLADGSISIDRYLDYRLWQIEADLKHVPGALTVDDVSFAKFGKETAEGLEAGAVARANMTTGAVNVALEQIGQMIAAAHMYAARLRQKKGA